MLTWAIAWMSVQMARAGKEVDGVNVLLFGSVMLDAALLGFCLEKIFG